MSRKTGRNQGRRPGSLLLCGVVALCFLVQPAWAQHRSPRNLVGTVVNAETGEVIEGARVIVSKPGSVLEREAVTDAQGSWVIDRLPGGDYVVAVERLGFALSADHRVTVPYDGDPLLLEISPDPLHLGTLVVTGSRRRQGVLNAPVLVEVIDREEVEQAGGAGLDAVLAQQLGVDLQGGHPTGSGIMIQGMDSRRILVMVDGQPYVGQVAGVTDMSRLPAAIVERIEVVKGPQSTLYGSDAMGGVVNVITRTGTAGTAASGGSARIGVGTRGRLDGSLFAAGTTGRLNYRGGGGWRRLNLTPGVSSTTGTRTGRGDAFAGATYAFESGSSLRASVLGTAEDQRWRLGQLNYFADNVQLNAVLGGEWVLGGQRVRPTLSLNRFDHLSRRGTLDTPPPGETGDHQRQDIVDGELLYSRAMGVLELDGGVRIRRESVGAERVEGGEKARTVGDLFAQGSLNLGALSIVSGIRVTRSGQYGTHAAPRLSALWRITDRFSLRGSVGTGYRVPDFKELHLEFLNVTPGFSYLVRGAPNLLPESSLNVSFTAEATTDRFYIRTTLFRNDFDNFIESLAVGDSAGAAVFTYANVLDGLTQGLEIDAGFAVDQLRLEGGVALLDTEDRVNGRELFGRPPVSGRLTASWTSPGGFSVTLRGLHTGETQMSSSDALFPGTPVGIDGLLPGGSGVPRVREAITRLDVAVSHRLSDVWSLKLGLDNVFDAIPANWPGYEGRLIHVSLGVDIPRF